MSISCDDNHYTTKAPVIQRAKMLNMLLSYSTRILSEAVEVCEIVILRFMAIALRFTLIGGGFISLFCCLMAYQSPKRI